MSKTLLSAALIMLLHPIMYSQSVKESWDTLSLQRLRDATISSDPLLLLFNSFSILYEYPFTKRDAFLLGFWYGKATETWPKMIEYPGYIRNYAPILACRRYF